MHGFFTSEIDLVSRIAYLSQDEFNHFKVLRIRNDEMISVTDGNGIFAKAYVNEVGKDVVKLNLVEEYSNFNEYNFNISLAFGLLQDKSRNEFIIEKGTELGVKNFIPLITERTQKVKFKRDRYEMKALSALKQCKRSIMPSISEPIDLKSIGNVIDNFRIILADIDGKTDLKLIDEDVVFIVGPEGGFSDKELNHLKKISESVKLSKAILRTETACINLISRYVQI